MTKEERMEADRKRSREIRAKFPEQIRKNLESTIILKRVNNGTRNMLRLGRKVKLTEIIFKLIGLKIQ